MSNPLQAIGETQNHRTIKALHTLNPKKPQEKPKNDPKTNQNVGSQVSPQEKQTEMLKDPTFSRAILQSLAENSGGVLRVSGLGDLGCRGFRV